MAESNPYKNVTPVHLLTGFLGSGKTTFLNRLLSDPDLADSAVLVNELGEIGIDHLIIETLSEDILLLESGCVCCSLRDDFSASLLELQDKMQRREIPAFKRVILETTGVADPIAILQSLMRDDLLTQHFTTGKVITVVDGVYGLTELEAHPEVLRQIVVADHLIFSKRSLTSSKDFTELCKAISAINPDASHSLAEDTHPSKLLTSSRQLQAGTMARLQRLTKRYEKSEQSISHDINSRYTSFTLSWSEDITLSQLLEWLDNLLYARGKEILRLKGLVHITGESRPMIVQAVQYSLYATRFLDQWPGQKRKTELVLIAQDFQKLAAINSTRPFFQVSHA